MRVNLEESIWTKYKPIVEANKEKRELKGCWFEHEPSEILIDDSLIGDKDNEGKLIHYPLNMYFLLSYQWVKDLFGDDWQITEKLLSVRDPDIVEVNGNLYFRESYIQNVLDVLTALAKTQFVNQLRPLPQTLICSSKPIYTSKDLMVILNVKDSTLRGYRDNCLLEYSKCGDKIWYTEDNLMDFINRHQIKNEF